MTLINPAYTSQQSRPSRALRFPAWEERFSLTGRLRSGPYQGIVFDTEINAARVIHVIGRTHSLT